MSLSRHTDCAGAVAPMEVFDHHAERLPAAIEVSATSAMQDRRGSSTEQATRAVLGRRRHRGVSQPALSQTQANDGLEPQAEDCRSRCHQEKLLGGQAIAGRRKRVKRWPDSRLQQDGPAPQSARRTCIARRTGLGVATLKHRQRTEATTTLHHPERTVEVRRDNKQCQGTPPTSV